MWSILIRATDSYRLKLSGELGETASGFVMDEVELDVEESDWKRDLAVGAIAASVDPRCSGLRYEWNGDADLRFIALVDVIDGRFLLPAVPAGKGRLLWKKEGRDGEREIDVRSSERIELSVP